MKILLNITYTNEGNKFWSDSYLRNKVISFDETKQTVHQAIADACMENDYMKLTYKGKPQGNIFRDKSDGLTEISGYMYRGQTEIEGKKAFFDVWASIYLVSAFTFEEIDN